MRTIGVDSCESPSVAFMTVGACSMEMVLVVVLFFVMVKSSDEGNQG